MNQSRLANGGGQARDAEFDIKPTDTVIAVMGTTGVGKSTFVNHFSENKKAPIGRSLESCTNTVELYKCSDYHLGEFYLVDTPGFDDTHRSDTEILMDIAGWLNRAFKEKILLTGIIYLHRIYDNRVGGAGMRNLRAFQRLCGPDAMSQVVLATTMWNMADDDTAKKNERELQTKSEFWGQMIANGSKVLRQDNDKESARNIIKHLIDKRARSTTAPKPLNIQVEMGVEGKTLDETGAGQEMQSQLAAQRKMYEDKLTQLRKELKQALKDKDEVWAAELELLKKEQKEKSAKADADRKQLKATNDALIKRLDEQEASDNDAWQKERDRQQRLASQLEYELKMMDAQRASFEDKQKLREQLMEERNKLEMLKWKIRQSQARCTVM